MIIGRELLDIVLTVVFLRYSSNLTLVNER